MSLRNIGGAGERNEEAGEREQDPRSAGDEERAPPAPAMLDEAAHQVAEGRAVASSRPTKLESSSSTWIFGRTAEITIRSR